MSSSSSLVHYFPKGEISSRKYLLEQGVHSYTLDRKMARLNREVNNKAEWQRLAELAYKASYGFEWNGDSLLLARENLLYSYRDYYCDKWNELPFFCVVWSIFIS